MVTDGIWFQWSVTRRIKFITIFPHNNRCEKIAFVKWPTSLNYPIKRVLYILYFHFAFIILLR